MKSFNHLSISIIGAGNIAWHFAKQLFACGYSINCVFSRNLNNAKLLAEQVNTKAVDAIAEVLPSDLYLLAVKDDAYQQIISSFPKTTAIYIHTSGSMDMEILKPLSPNYGVLYPFQTLTKRNEILFQKVPLCIEASNEFTLAVLSNIANDLESPCYAINSQQRAYLHLCGVFASNFTNVLYNIAEQIARQQQIDFEIIKPLIREAAYKIETLSPAEAQTGPAKRNDLAIMQKHVEMLTYPKWKEIYKLLSEFIIAQK